MDLSIFKVKEVTEQINVHNGGWPFVTRTLRITDEEGSVFQIKIFADDKRDLTTSKFEEEIHA
jgi:hypothetical protein